MSGHNTALFGPWQRTIALARRLHERRWPYVVACSTEQDLHRLRDAGFQACVVDHTDDEALLQLGIGCHIDTVIGAFTSDADNVFLAISVRALAPDARIIATGISASTTQRLYAAGVNEVVELYDIIGREVLRVLQAPSTVDLLENVFFSQVDLDFDELSFAALVDAVGSCCMTELDRYLRRQHNVVLIGLVPHGMAFMLAAEAPERFLCTTDTLLVAGPCRALEQLKRADFS